MSIRSSAIEVDKILKEALKHFDGYGGGHTHAVGANIKVADFPEFVRFFEKEAKEVSRK